MLVIAVVGALMILYVLVGGMKGTTWVQIIKAVLLIVGAAVMTIWVLAQFGFNFSDLLAGRHRHGRRGRRGAASSRASSTARASMSQLNFLSLALALVLGTAGLPHVLMRFYTVPTAKEARRSVVWAIWLIGIFYLFTLVLGYGAAALVGPEAIKAAPGGVNSAAPLLAYELGGTILLGLISAVAFATILAVVAGLTITAAASFAHDIYASVIKHGEVKPDGEVRVARITVVVIGILAIIGGIFANGQNVAFLVALAFAVAASANLPTILYSLFWKRFNTSGALWSIYGGLISCLVLIAFSPVVSGKVDPVTGASLSMIKNTDDRLPPDPAGEPGPDLDPARRSCSGSSGTYLSKEQVEPGEVRRDGGPVAHRRRLREGRRALTRRTPARAAGPQPGGRPRCVTKIAVPGSRAPRTGPHPPQVRSCPAGHSGSTSRSRTKPGGDELADVVAERPVVLGVQHAARLADLGVRASGRSTSASRSGRPRPGRRGTPSGPGASPRTPTARPAAGRVRPPRARGRRRARTGARRTR